MARMLDLVVTASPQHRSYLRPPAVFDLLRVPSRKSLVVCTETDWCVGCELPCRLALSMAIGNEGEEGGDATLLPKHNCDAASVVVQCANGGLICLQTAELPIGRIQLWLKAETGGEHEERTVVLSQSAMLMLSRDSKGTKARDHPSKGFRGKAFADQLRGLADACRDANARLVLCTYTIKDASDVLEELQGLASG